MSGLLASLALIGGFIASMALLMLVTWFGFYWMSRREALAG
jgi:hypothetical protein